MRTSTISSTDIRAGICAGAVHCMENHDAALALWRDAGVAERVLVHVDAHHDLYGPWIDRKNPGERARITIANFVYAALEEDLVREVIWVVPDQTWLTPAGRRDIVRELRRLDQGVGHGKPAIAVEPDRIIGTVLGKRVLACTAGHLPALDEAVLLDVDVDYFVIPNVGYRNIDTYGALPWCWPDQLLLQLRARRIQADLTTIAYSVEGDYTPLQWKFLGDELAQRLQSASADPVWDHMREAAQAAARGDFPLAETHYLTASRLRPALAAPRYHLAHLCAVTARLQAGRDYLRQACDLDVSYRSPYNSAGWWYLENRRHKQAQAAFARALSLDPGDAYAHLGNGLLAIQERNWPLAEASLRRALALDDRCVEAHRALGRVLARYGSGAEAAAAYEQSLQLALAGRRALTNPITLGASHGRGTPWDPDHGTVLAELARLQAAAGAWEKAITDYRMAIAAGGINAAGAWTSLALLYARSGRMRDCAHAFFQVSKRLPRALILWIERRWSGLRETLQYALQTLRSKRRAGAPPQMWL